MAIKYFDLNKITRNMYIDEVCQYKEFLSNGNYQNFACQVNKDISIMYNKLENDYDSLSDLDMHCRIQEFDYFKSLKMLSVYRYLSSFYLTLFSIWELQIENYDEKIKKYYNNRIEEFANLVNVLKHGKKALKPNKKSAFEKLQEMKSFYLNKSIEFNAIIEGIHGGEILNISLTDLLSLCDEIIKIWKNMK